MNLGTLLAEARKRLADHGIDDASLEAEVLVRHVLELDRAALHASPERPVSEAESRAIHRLIERRLTGEPTAYITGHREFYGLDFIVTPDVLIPRPETELLVDLALAGIKENGYKTAADIGTGSGNIAVCLAVSVPDLMVTPIDIRGNALIIAMQNAARHKVIDRMHFELGDLLEPLEEPVDVICANLPYVTTSELIVDGPLHFEPQDALDGGPDGLDVFRDFVPMVPYALKPGGSLYLEIGEGQGEAVKEMVNRDLPGAFVSVHRDLAGRDRVVMVRLTP